jgi:hypothetical protein
VSDETRRPLEPGNKRVDVTLIIHTYEDVPADWDDASIRFWVVENHCLGNYLTQIQQDEAKAKEGMGLHDDTGICQLCSFAEARVGHLPFPPETL